MTRIELITNFLKEKQIDDQSGWDDFEVIEFAKYYKQKTLLNREDLMDKIEEIQLRNYRTFKGTNEADLMIREEIADLILKK